MAKGGAYGIWEGRIISLAHPAIMVCVYAATAFSAFSGWQWRRLREIGGEITALKAELKGPSAQIAAHEGEGEGDTPPPALVAQANALQTQIDELTATRKELANGDFRDKHYRTRRATARRTASPASHTSHTSLASARLTHSRLAPGATLPPTPRRCAPPRARANTSELLIALSPHRAARRAQRPARSSSVWAPRLPSRARSTPSCAHKSSSLGRTSTRAPASSCVLPSSHQPSPITRALTRALTHKLPSLARTSTPGAGIFRASCDASHASVARRPWRERCPAAVAWWQAS
jgi:hypothetical protein